MILSDNEVLTLLHAIEAYSRELSRHPNPRAKMSRAKGE